MIRSVQLNDCMNSYISCGMAPSHIIGASNSDEHFRILSQSSKVATVNLTANNSSDVPDAELKMYILLVWE